MFNLLYRGTRDGFYTTSFHQRCDRVGATISIIKTDTNCIFGGYTIIPWDINKGNVTAKKNSWLFRLEDNLSFTKINYNNGPFDHEVTHEKEMMVSFGHDLTIYDHCDKNK